MRCSTGRSWHDRPAEGAARLRPALARGLAAWAAEEQRVRAVALVGSYARGTARLASDLDLLLLTADPDGLAAAVAAAVRRLAPGSPHLDSTRYGPVCAQHLRTRRGLHLELDVAPLDRARPVDPGPARVARDGLVALHDPDGVLEALLAEVGAT